MTEGETDDKHQIVDGQGKQSPNLIVNRLRNHR